ncbi:MAG: DUF933 domain-containing protein [Chloroflexota bacterium]|nr:DUF933 domain-containing protein [Chloroflexota bacterium]MDE2919209.1 DUF933 domain-containing protein [Chloroflexota bacterium]
MPEIALAGDFESGVEAVFAAAIGRHVVDTPQGRLSLQTGVMPLPDPRLRPLQSVFNAAQTVPVSFTLWHAPGQALAAGEPPNGEWIGRLRTADALLLAVSGQGGLEAAAQRASDLRTELAVLDLAILEPAQQRLEERVTSGPRVDRREAGEQLAIVTRARESLEAERPLLEGLSPREAASLRGFGLLGAKPCAVACNAPDDEAAAIDAQRAAAHHDDWCVVAAATEAELDDLSEQDAAEFRADLGLPGLASQRLGQALRRGLDYITFYTGNSRSVNAWLLPRGATALDAAAAIHTDLAAGFIRADAVAANDLIAAGSMAALRDRGQIRRVGRDYLVSDAEVIQVHFSR